jgi:hypothetical protein
LGPFYHEVSVVSLSETPTCGRSGLFADKNLDNTIEMPEKITASMKFV